MPLLGWEGGGGTLGLKDLIAFYAADQYIHMFTSSLEVTFFFLLNSNTLRICKNYLDNGRKYKNIRKKIHKQYCRIFVYKV